MPHNPDIGVLMRACNVHDLPLATNRAAADLIMTGFGVLSLQ
jgi:methylglyoxal synthase